MKKIAVALFLMLCIISCKKQKAEELTEQKATVTLIKYACGLACDAVTYTIKTADKEIYYVPDRLPDAFKLDGLKVTISFKRTGKYPNQFDGPAYEIINLVTINLQ